MRVHELAKMLGMPSKDLIARINQLGGSVKNHMSQLDAATLQLIQGKVSAAAVSGNAKEKEAVPAAADVSLEHEKNRLAPAAVQEKADPLSVTEAHPAAPSAVPVETPSESSDTAQIVLQIPITVGNLAEQFRLRVSEVIKHLMEVGIFANVNQLLNEEIVFKLAGKLGIKVRKHEDEAAQVVDKKQEDEPAKLKPRPPVVTMMGHVDHGKTSLLDAIRKTNVAAKEKGFITQHIGAYGVDIPGKGHVTFLDTPGHEAFTAMRARGANITDVVVLVVAADDGVMPQTVEAVDHAREAGCPIVVAVNKSDLPGANPQKVMLGLQKLNLIPEEWGGKTICVKVSAKTGQGLEELLEMLLLEAEILELKANPDRLAVGTVVEGHLSKGSGPVATIIVQKGTLRIGDTVVAGPYMGRVRSLRNDRGKAVKEAGPSYAVEVSGLNGIPEAGEIVFAVQDEKTARNITEQRVLELRERQMRGTPKHLSLQDFYSGISEGKYKELKLIIKADVQGSAEALAQSLERLASDKCSLRVIHSGIGGVNESDVMLAAASDAVIIGFHVRAAAEAEELSKKEGVEMRFYQIIYEAVDEVRKAMEGLLEPTYREALEGKIEIRKVFKSSRVGTIGGGMVLKGKVTRQSSVRVIRDHIIVFEGKLASLRRFQDDVREVAEGYECGVALQGFNDLHERDVVESFRLEKIAAKL